MKLFSSLCVLSLYKMKSQAVTIATTTARRQSDQNGRQQGATVMAKVIEYYIPSKHKKKTRWVPESLRGKVIDFPIELKKPA
jgi:hypothetical protein